VALARDGRAAAPFADGFAGVPVEPPFVVAEVGAFLLDLAVLVVDSFLVLVAARAAGVFFVAVPDGAAAFAAVFVFGLVAASGAFAFVVAPVVGFAVPVVFAVGRSFAVPSPFVSLVVARLRVVVPVATLSSSSGRPGRPVLSSISPAAHALA
jgi:hypothetical protein